MLKVLKGAEGADPERKSEDGDGGGAGLAYELADDGANVLEQVST